MNVPDQGEVMEEPGPANSTATVELRSDFWGGLTLMLEQGQNMHITVSKCKYNIA